MRKTTPLLLLLVFAGVVLAQPAPTPSVPDPTVPTWVFYWAIGGAGTIILALVAVIVALWNKLSKKSALTVVQANQLQDLHAWHDKRDGDQTPLWYVPRVWVELLHQLIAGQKTLTDLVQRVVEQSDGVTDDLRQQLRDRLSLHDKQQNKMLKLAVRVQRAVEALAGLETPEIEEDLGDETEA
jgi:hypothetical protein